MNRHPVAACAFFISSTLSGYTAQSGLFTYVEHDTTIEITDYPENATGDAVIPGEIVGKPVTSIGDDAFRDCSSLTSVTIHDSVTSIGEAAFRNCSSLTNVTIPDSVTSIGDQAFTDCSSLTSATIPDSVTSIADYAFYGCSSLTNISLPDGVRGIGKWAFAYCYSLTSVTIPDSMIGILEGAFSGCISLPSVTIPDSVTHIGNWAFRDCSSLTNISIPDRVTRISNEAFWGCISLTNVTIPDRVTSIGDYAFNNCTGLTSVTIGGGVTSIGTYAFRDCERLTSVYFKGNAPSDNVTIFEGADNATVYYLPGTTGWGVTYGGLPTAEAPLGGPDQESVLIVSLPVQVEPNARYDVEVSYTAAEERDIIIRLLNPANNQSWHGGVQARAEAGSANKQYQVLIENEPQVGNSYIWDVMLVPVGGDYTQAISWVQQGAEVLEGIDFARWKQVQFSFDELNDVLLSGELSDPDQDGCINILEYVFGGNPKQAEGSLVESVIIEEAGVSYHGLQFNHLYNRGDIRFSAENSLDLKLWSEEIQDVDIIYEIEANGTETVKIRNRQSMEAGGSRYMRLRIIDFPMVTFPRLKRGHDSEQPTVFLAPSGNIDFSHIEESSGLVKGQLGDYYWTHNDSGNSNQVFAISRDGSLIQPEDAVNYRGIPIDGAINVDWEDITKDDQGNLIIGDLGNNGNARRDLAVYIVPEPNPYQDLFVTGATKMGIHYPDQTEFPPLQNNFDSEAIFYAKGSLYVLTKHRADTRTKLYRLDGKSTTTSNALTYLDSFDIGGSVTAADAQLDGSKLVILTYNNVWMFEPIHGRDDYFDGEVYWLPIGAYQIEAIAFIDEDTVLLSNEQRSLFEISQADFVRLR